MVYLKTALEVTMALFAVIGVYSVARLLAQKIYGSRRLVLAVEIFCEDDLDEAEAAIRDALAQFLLVPSGRVCVLTTAEWAAHPALIALTRKYGVELCVLAPKET